MSFTSPDSIFGSFVCEQNIRNGDFESKSKHAEKLFKLFCNSIDVKEIDEINCVKTFSESIEYIHPGLNSKEYILHPIRVAALGGMLSKENRLNIARVGLLHNVYETSHITSDVIIREFGNEIHSVLEILTINRERQSDHYYLQDYYESIAQLQSGLGIVKVIDKIDNLFSLDFTATSFTRRSYLNEVNEFLIPLCDRVAPHLNSFLLSMIRHHDLNLNDGSI
jgi:(p)ppGpp synthase/HD superfamily hydrolase